MNKFNEILLHLQLISNEEIILFKQNKFGIKSNHPSYGILMKDLNDIAKQHKNNSDLAMQLFEENHYETKILCSKIFNPKDLTLEISNKWIQAFDTWEMADSFSLFQFSKNKIIIPLIEDWAENEKEFIRRTAFATIASLCMADKKSNNEVFEGFFNLIKRYAFDERIYVRKAVNWALRNIGKRNIDLNRMAINIANDLVELDSKSAKWIGKNALAELTSPKVRISDYPRAIYRTS